MTIKQLSVFVENRRGKLAEITEALATEGIDLRALSLSDASEFGLLRLIVSKPDEAYTLLREKGMMVRANEVVAIGVADKPGGFSEATRIISGAGVNLEYMYTLASPKAGEAVIITRIDQPGEAISALLENGFRIVGPEEIYG